MAGRNDSDNIAPPSSFFYDFNKKMDNFITAMSTKSAETLNGAITNITTLNSCLDLFALIGERKDYSDTFWAAFGENPDIALKILFWSRDCRGGAGSRKTFIEVMKTMQSTHPDVFKKLFKYIPEFGYWKDLYQFQPDDDIVSFIADELKYNQSEFSLCAKYAPRQGYWASLLRKKLGMEQKDYRKYLVEHSTTVEQKMCANDWENIDYSTVPSVAGSRYVRQFMKHDYKRYKEYLDKVNTGEAKINASVLTPPELLSQFVNINYLYYRDMHDSGWGITNPDALRAYWNNLPDYMEGCTERILPVVDISGSMQAGYGNVIPLWVSVGLGLYISQHNQGPFHNCLISFSDEPLFYHFKGEDILDRLHQFSNVNMGFNTDLQKTFTVLLKQAMVHNLKQEDMPTKIIIISDMEFDEATCNTDTNLEAIDKLYRKNGYKRPGIIFWNVNGRQGNFPTTKEDKNTALVSGYSPAILKSLLKGIVLTPLVIMLDVVDTERYQDIHI